MTNFPDDKKIKKNTIPMEQEIRGLHDDEKKIKVYTEIIKVSESTKEITILELSKIVSYEPSKLNIFIEELILADKINAKKKDDIISFK